MGIIVQIKPLHVMLKYQLLFIILAIILGPCTISIAYLTILSHTAAYAFLGVIRTCMYTTIYRDHPWARPTVAVIRRFPVYSLHVHVQCRWTQWTRLIAQVCVVHIQHATHLMDG